MRALAPLLLAATLGGCNALGGFTGAAATIATSVATANPVIGLSVGIGVKAATDQAVSTITRRRQQAEQDAIADAVADMYPGETRTWSLDRRFGGEERGEVRVVRVIETPLALCKEIVFSVVDGDGQSPRRAWFTTSACRTGERWKWAAAEPAVDRWGNLQ